MARTSATQSKPTVLDAVTIMVGERRREIVLVAGLFASTFAVVSLLGWSATSVVTALLARRLPAGFTPRAQLAAGLLGVAAGQAMLTGIDARAGVG